MYAVKTMPYQTRPLAGDWLAVSSAGDYVFLNKEQAELLAQGRVSNLPLSMQADLKARYFIASDSGTGTCRLLASRQAAKRETVTSGPSLHIIVPTLQCAHSCQYCQVSRSLADTGHTISHKDLLAACDSIFESKAPTLTIEFQGGDPLLRFDLVREAVIRIQQRNRTERRQLRFVIASTLHQLTPDMCDFLAQHSVFLSTSIDGPAELHNRNRPIPGRNSYERTVAGIELARNRLGKDAVAALMTTTKASLAHPEAIVDEYVKLGFQEI
ncbi:radical SAM protein, partial [Achromobacter xylosoxidans]